MNAFPLDVSFCKKSTFDVCIRFYTSDLHCLILTFDVSEVSRLSFEIGQTKIGH